MKALSELATETSPVVLAVGTFDGVHKGHQRVISTAKRIARECDGKAWVLTFEPHPASVISPNLQPARLSTADQKVGLIQSLDVDGCAVVDFTETFSQLSPEQFIDELTQAIPTLHTVVVGGNWRFGHRASGTTDTLWQLANDKGFTAAVSDYEAWQGSAISSTRIREAIKIGDVAAAAEMLGHPYEVVGEVSEGRQIGRRLGFPTANVSVRDVLIPSPGIYAAHVSLNQDVVGGAVYIAAQQDSTSSSVIEVHCLDREENLYGASLAIRFLQHIRNPRAFRDDDDAREQIADDVQRIRKICNDAQLANCK